jgi:hypothetical protein
MKANAWMYSTATDAILQYHVLFASLMARRIDDASEFQYNMKCDDSETTRLAKNISDASRSLSITVASMKDGVDLFVSALQNVQVAMKHERSLAERILRWLKSLFKVIASTLDTVCLPISAVPLPAEPKRQKSAILVSTLREAAAKICTADPGAFSEHISPCKDRVIDYLIQNPRMGKNLRALTS